MTERKPGPGQLGLFGHPAPPDPVERRKVEHKKRDEVLDALGQTRAALIRKAGEIALRIAHRKGNVTSVEVFDELKREGLGPMLTLYDPRWIGAVFRSGNGWRKQGYSTDGSHGRPVSVWERGQR